MADSTEAPVQSYFAYDREALAFQNALLCKFGEIQEAVVGKYLKPENTQRFRHGGGWSNPSSPHAPAVQWHTHSAETETRFEDIVNCDLSQIDQTLAAFRGAMEKQFAEMIYSTVSQAAEEVGNVVDATTERSLADAFMATIEKIDFMADKHGEVHLPEIHVAPDTGARMIAAMASAPQEFRNQLEALKARKPEEALAREVERKAKFVRYGPLPCAS